MGERNRTPDRMKIAWLTPLASTSAIGRYSRLVVNELSKRHEVQVLTFGDFKLPEMTVPVRVMRDHKEAAAAVNDFDVAVYQIGNYWPFHGEIMLTARTHPGIVVLHDYTIQHLIAHYCLEYLHDPEEFKRLTQESEGDAAGQRPQAMGGSWVPVPADDAAIRNPLTDFVTANALGVIAHSKYALNGVRAHCECPVAVLALPYNAPRPPLRPTADLGIPPDSLVVLTIGHINPNKQAKAVILALGELPERLKTRVTYVLAGPIDSWYAEELRAAADATGLSDQVRIEGYVDEARLYALMERADLCVNLRYPNYEGASASLIEEMLAGKAVVASDTGAFGELPPDVVQFARSEEELPEVLSDLLRSKEDREALAARGRAYARCTFRADTYAEGFSGFATRVVREAPVRRLEHEITARAGLLGFREDAAWARSVHERIRELFLSR